MSARDWAFVVIGLVAFIYLAYLKLRVHHLEIEVFCYQSAIRAHMNQRGDDRCCGDDHDLYEVLPQGDARPPVESAVTIENCLRFIACQQSCSQQVYISPQRYIEKLEQWILARGGDDLLDIQNELILGTWADDSFSEDGLWD